MKKRRCKNRDELDALYKIRKTGIDQSKNICTKMNSIQNMQMYHKARENYIAEQMAAAEQEKLG